MGKDSKNNNQKTDQIDETANTGGYKGKRRKRPTIKLQMQGLKTKIKKYVKVNKIYSKKLKFQNQVTIMIFSICYFY